MKAVVFHGIGDIRLEDVKEPKIKDPTDAVVRLTASAICGTDLHMIRGTLPGMKPGTILGHEGVRVAATALTAVPVITRSVTKRTPSGGKAEQLSSAGRVAAGSTYTNVGPVSSSDVSVAKPFAVWYFFRPTISARNLAQI